MASLPKPFDCQHCGSSNLKRYKTPERWVCQDCEHVVASRPSRLLAKDKCRRCGAGRGEKPFKRGKNICLDCTNVEAAEWRIRRADHWRAYKQRPDIKDKRYETVLRCIQKSPQAFLRYLMRSLRKSSRHEQVKLGKLNKASLDVRIDADFLYALWDAQDGHCAILGVPMLHQLRSLQAVSIDRIDSTKGYVPGNVQLVCQFVNTAKRHYSNEDVRAVLDAYFRARVAAEGWEPAAALILSEKD